MIEDKEHMAYIARCKCGNLIFACVDNPEDKKDTAKEVSKIIKEGYVVERMTCEEVRKSNWCNNHGNCK